LIMKDGKRILFEANGDVIRDPAGMPTGMVFVGRDITERRILESKLREANRKLRVMDGITRHDTLNKLMALQGYVDLMKKGREDAKDLDRLNRMDQIVTFLRDQVNVTKEYQKIGADSPEWQSVRAVCLRAAELAHLGKVSIDIDVDDLQILADPLLYKVFYNLMDNSLRHGISVDRISISEERSSEGTTIVLSDNGSGISPEDRANLFKEGYGRVHGLGLFLSREILDITGITIKETGEPGQGARFEIRVPKGSFRTGPT
jgi:signal transduction histidine kinase